MMPITTKCRHLHSLQSKVGERQNDPSADKKRVMVRSDAFKNKYNMNERMSVCMHLRREHCLNVKTKTMALETLIPRQEC